MKLASRFLTIAALGSALAATYLTAAEFFPGHHGHCQNCQVVEETVYQDVITHRCRLHPDKKQKKETVYSVKEVPFCLHKLTCSLKHDTCCDKCKECECCARYKKVLVKKEVVVCEECTTKCVPEAIVTRVPCKVQRVIPCPSCATGLAAPVVR
jgi:hypothetical protein